MNNKITKPEIFFGEMPGSDGFMIHWDKLCDYYRELERCSDRIKITSPGKSTGGKEFLILYVSSERNLENLERYREISMKLANNEDISEAEAESLSREGKAVVFQSYGLHSNEVGGPQCVPIILYDLLTAEEGSELYNVLENVIFIVSPCSEPDGEVMFHDWYNKYKGTKYDGSYCPHLRHSHAGHCNNRDAIHERVCESRYLNDVIIRNWCPQVFQDHHHADPTEERMMISPASNPIYPYSSPVLIQETATYGAVMATELYSNGRTGIVSGAEFYNNFPITTFYSVAKLHNIGGMLTESADARIASPIYIHPNNITVYRFPTLQCPMPWKGGEWHLSDIVTNIRIASLSILKYAATNKELMLRGMHIKAKMQTERGAEDSKYAFFIPKAQHDKTALTSLIRTMQAQRIRVYESIEEITCGARTYPKGTYVVPLAQPKYALIYLFLDKIAYPMSKYCYKDDGTIRITDSANLSVALCMGVETAPAYERVDMTKLTHAKEVCDYIPDKFPMDVRNNGSFMAANKALSEGIPVYRDTEGNFYNEKADGRREIKRMKVALYLRSNSGGNLEAGFTRNILETYGFDLVMLTDKEIRDNGIDESLDAIIFSGDREDFITSGDNPTDILPKEYHTGIGTNGLKALRAFAERGGRIITFQQSCVFLNKFFALGMRNIVDGLPAEKFGTFGSQINAHLEDGKTSEFLYGMAKNFTVIHNTDPVLIPKDIVHRVDVLVRAEREGILECGFATGIEKLSDAPLLMTSKYGRGDLIMYAFNPHFRFQQDSTFKLLFNALYKYID